MSLWATFLLKFTLLLLSSFVSSSWYIPALGDDSCFCQLSGQVDDGCCCSIEDVDRLNSIYIHPRLKNLVTRNYFRYLKLDLKRVCPFWPEDDQCAVKDCKVDTCSEDELPVGFKGQECSNGKEESLGKVDVTISDEQKTTFDVWSSYDSSHSFCINLEENGEDAVWVDLLLNPEQYTGYKGKGANRIWKSIYMENCFLPKTVLRSYDNLKSNFLSKTCLEKRVFYRILSGLHASVNIHVSYMYIVKESLLSKPRFAPNLDDFRMRFDPESTHGNGPYWLKNLYFTYLLAVRAVTKAAPYWKEFSFYTGDEKEDAEFKSVILELINTAKTCPSTFDESEMFTGDTLKVKNLKEEFRQHYHNITRIMGCVGCSKCRLWGRLQTTGIGTALKILFSSDKWDEVPVINGVKFSLTRTEIVSLFNALNKLSQSLIYVNEFKTLNSNHRQSQ